MKPRFFFTNLRIFFLTKFGVFLIILAERFGLLFDAAENNKVYKYFVKKLKIGENKFVV